MLNMLRAEHLKMQHTFGQNLAIIFPVFTLLLVLFLMGGTGNEMLPAAAWNWWYTMLLPGMAAIMCYLGINKDKKIHYYNMLVIPSGPGKCIICKTVYYIAGFLLSNIVLCAGTLVFGKVYGTTIGIKESLIAVILLCVTFLWEIPLYILASLRFRMSGCIGLCLFLSFTSFVFADTWLWWAWPSSIPVRLMCPVLGIMPNGLLAPPESNLLKTGVILPGIIISSVWFILSGSLMIHWFNRKVAEI